jgi:predicted PurR-regulated permease PerM
MALLSLIPSAGSFVIWIPAAIVLATQGEWWRAVLLAGWGTLVVGTIDNILYPWLVGHETRLHTLVVFLAVVGGLLVFGAAGIVLGPVAAAATVTLLDILKARGRRPAHRDAAAASG